MAVIHASSFMRFDNFDRQIGRIAVFKATHKENLNGTDELTLLCKDDLRKGDRIVWKDIDAQQNERWHEHIVDSVKRTHDDSGNPMTEAVCINSLAELWDDWIDVVKIPMDTSVGDMLESILENTRWRVIDNTFSDELKGRIYRDISVREALADIANDAVDCRFETEISADSMVYDRCIKVKLKGENHTAKRFTWTKDIIGITRKVSNDNPKTRVYGFGKKTGEGSDSDYLTFGSINDGKNYIEDAEATQLFGHLDANGNVTPAVGKYVNEDCDDAADLLKKTRNYLTKASKPSVSYEASVIDLAALGYQWEAIDLGDYVSIIDKEFCENGLRIEARISEIQRDLVNGDVSIIFGNVSHNMADYFQSVAKLQQSPARQLL